MSDPRGGDPDVALDTQAEVACPCCGETAVIGLDPGVLTRAAPHPVPHRSRQVQPRLKNGQTRLSAEPHLLFSEDLLHLADFL